METDKNLKKKGYLKISALLIILILLVVSAGLAYAKYVTSRSGTATATVAEFNFNLKNLQGQVSTASNPVDFPITRTDENKKVETGKLAPDTYGRFDMIIDSTGTQVSYRYDIEVTVTNCPTNLIFYTDKDHQNAITTTRTGTGTTQDPKIATFTISKYVPINRANEQHKEIVYWEWPYETGNTANEIYANDLLDSADMEKMVTMNIVATGTQVSSQPAGVPMVGEQPQTISIVKLDVSQVDNTTATLDLGTQAEVVLSYTQTPTNLEDLFISSSDSSVATAAVDLANNKVVVNALKKGTATITLRGEHSWNITKTIAVTVQGTNVNELVLSSDNSTVSVAPGGTESVTINNFANLHPVETFTISSSDSSIATASYDNNGTITISGVATGTATITLTGTQSGTTKIIAVKVQLEIGDTVNYTTTLNGVTLDNNWKIFNIDENNVYLIYGGYLPVSAVNIANISKGTDYAVYVNSSDGDRNTLINAMTNKANWSSLLTGTLNGKAISYSTSSSVWAMGAPTLEQFAASWNSTSNGFTTTITPEEYNANDVAQGTVNAPGYKVNGGYSLSIPSADKSNAKYSLYVPYTAKKGDSNGYWLASPSALSAGNVVRVGYNGSVGIGNFILTYYAFRPLVCLPSSVLE